MVINVIIGVKLEIGGWCSKSETRVRLGGDGGEV